jgi:hypothetical protein
LWRGKPGPESSVAAGAREKRRWPPEIEKQRWLPEQARREAEMAAGIRDRENVGANATVASGAWVLYKIPYANTT